LILEIVGAVVSGTASITDVSTEVPVVDAPPLTVLDPTTIDLTYLPASFDVKVYVEVVADPMVEHVVKSVADVQLCHEYANEILIGAATKETVEVKIELTAVVPLGAVVVATTGITDLLVLLHVPEEINFFGGLSPSAFTAITYGSNTRSYHPPVML
jgi:hypothetical protein